MTNIKIRSLSRDLNSKGAMDSALFAQLTHGRAHEFIDTMGAFGIKLPTAASKGQKYKDTFIKACQAVHVGQLAGLIVSHVTFGQDGKRSVTSSPITKHEKAVVLGALAVAAGLMAGTVEATNAPEAYTTEYAQALESLTPAKTEAQILGAAKAQATREAKKEAEARAAAVTKNLEIVTTVTALQICEAIQSGRFEISELQAIADAISTQADVKPV